MISRYQSHEKNILSTYVYALHMLYLYKHYGQFKGEAIKECVDYY